MVTVWFVRSHRLGWRRAIRFFVYRKRAALAGGLVWAVGFRGRGLIHVAVGCGHEVVQPTLTGFERWPLVEYGIRSRRLVGVFIIPGDVELPAGGTVPLFLSLLHWLTRGRVSSGDCVSYAVRVLGRVGVEVPSSVLKPVHLFDFLRARGFEYEELE